MRVTRRGSAALYAALGMLIADALLNDLALEILPLGVLVVVASDVVWTGFAVSRVSSRIKLSEENTSVSLARRALFPGEESAIGVSLSKRVGGRARFLSRVPFQKIEPAVVSGYSPNARLTFSFVTPYAGQYSGDDVEVELTGPFGLFSSRGSIPLRQKYVVHPEVLAVAASTIRLLGREEIGETPIQAPGPGSEFYEMRNYLPGDDYRLVNWKATARMGELIVVEHMKEVGSSFLLVLDSRAPGFFYADRLASTFLSLANSLDSSGLNFGILVHDGKTVTATSPEGDPRGSLGLALRSAVGSVRLDSSPEFLELVPARLAGKLGLKKDFPLRGTSLSQLRGLRREELKSILQMQDPWQTISNYVRDRGTRSVIYVSGLYGAIEPVIEMSWQLRHLRDTDFSLVNPCEPSNESDPAEDRVRLAARNRTIASLLRRAEIRYYKGEPFELARRVLAE